MNIFIRKKFGTVTWLITRSVISKRTYMAIIVIASIQKPHRNYLIEQNVTIAVAFDVNKLHFYHKMNILLTYHQCDVIGVKDAIKLGGWASGRLIRIDNRTNN